MFVFNFCDVFCEQDDEINNQSQLVEKLREQLIEQEELILSLRKEYDTVQVEQQRIQAENDSAKDEVITYLYTIYHFQLIDLFCNISLLLTTGEYHINLYLSCTHDEVLNRTTRCSGDV